MSAHASTFFSQLLKQSKLFIKSNFSFVSKQFNWYALFTLNLFDDIHHHTHIESSRSRSNDDPKAREKNAIFSKNRSQFFFWFKQNVVQWFRSSGIDVYCVFTHWKWLPSSIHFHNNWNHVRFFYWLKSIQKQIRLSWLSFSVAWHKINCHNLKRKKNTHRAIYRYPHFVYRVPSIRLYLIVCL